MRACGEVFSVHMCSGTEMSILPCVVHKTKDVDITLHIFRMTAMI